MVPPLEIFHSHRTVPPAGATIWISDTGRITTADTSRRWWQRDYVCLHIVQSGRGRIETDLGTVDLERGGMFCLWPGMALTYGRAPGYSWEVGWVHLIGPGDVAFGKACGFGESRLTHRPADPEAACARFEELFGLFQEGGDRQPHRALQILHGIAAACQGEEEATSSPQHPESLLVARARRILDYDLHQGLNVTELADRLGVSRTTLFLAFRNELGTTPVEYLTQVRLDRAKQLLRHTEYTLETIAGMVGFAHPKSFLKRFRQREGIPPGHWRQRDRNG